MTEQPKREAAGPRTPNVLPGGSRVDALMNGDAAPLRRDKRRSGYPGKPELGIADARIRQALSVLARDPDPEARKAGVDLAAEAIAALNDFARRAEESSTRHKRLMAKVARTDRKLEAAQAKVAGGGSVARGFGGAA